MDCMLIYYFIIEKKKNNQASLDYIIAVVYFPGLNNSTVRARRRDQSETADTRFPVSHSSPAQPLLLVRETIRSQFDASVRG